MNAEQNLNVRIARRFAAAPARVFDAWLNSEKARRFLFVTPSGQMIRSEIDPRVGGSFSFVDRRDGEEVEHTGKYLEIDRPQLLVFTLSVEKYSRGESRVIIEIAPFGGGCKLTLTHVGGAAGIRRAHRSRLDGHTQRVGLDFGRRFGANG